MTDWTETIGMLAGLLTTMAFAPQVVQTWNSGSARDFSLWMLLMFAAGAGLLLASCILSVKLRRG